MAQPVLFALEYALARTWQTWGIEPAAVLGHSAGEYVAACLAGVFSLEEGLRLIVARGRSMQACPEGAMLACFTPLETVQQLIEPFGTNLSIAALNGPESVVVSGERQSVEELHVALAERGIVSRDLHGCRAFHSRLIEPALDGLRLAAASVVYHMPTLRLISNVTGSFVTAPPDAAYWVRHARQPVRFAEGIRKLHEAGITHFLEVGPDAVLSRLGRACIAAPDSVWLASLQRQRDDETQMLQSLATLYQDGAAVRWKHWAHAVARLPCQPTPSSANAFGSTATPVQAVQHQRRRMAACRTGCRARTGRSRCREWTPAWKSPTFRPPSPLIRQRVEMSRFPGTLPRHVVSSMHLPPTMWCRPWCNWAGSRNRARPISSIRLQLHAESCRATSGCCSACWPLALRKAGYGCKATLVSSWACQRPVPRRTA